jgi:hypothetical protein
MMNEQLNESTYKQSLEDEAKQLGVAEVLNPAYQRKKLLLWLVRNAITALICWYFWEKEWVKWVLWIGIPLALLNLLMILLGPYLLRKKLQSVQKKINRMS